MKNNCPYDDFACATYHFCDNCKNKPTTKKMKKTKKQTQPTILHFGTIAVYSDETIEIKFGKFIDKRISIIKFVKNVKEFALQIPDNDKGIAAFLEQIGQEYNDEHNIMPNKKKKTNGRKK